MDDKQGFLSARTKLVKVKTYDKSIDMNSNTNEEPAPVAKVKNSKAIKSYNMGYVPVGFKRNNAPKKVELSLLDRMNNNTAKLGAMFMVITSTTGQRYMQGQEMGTPTQNNKARNAYEVLLDEYVKILNKNLSKNEEQRRVNTIIKIFEDKLTSIYKKNMSGSEAHDVMQAAAQLVAGASHVGPRSVDLSDQPTTAEVDEWLRIYSEPPLSSMESKHGELEVKEESTPRSFSDILSDIDWSGFEKNIEDAYNVKLTPALEASLEGDGGSALNTLASNMYLDVMGKLDLIRSIEYLRDDEKDILAQTLDNIKGEMGNLKNEIEHAIVDPSDALQIIITKIENYDRKIEDKLLHIREKVDNLPSTPPTPKAPKAPKAPPPPPFLSEVSSASPIVSVPSRVGQSVSVPAFLTFNTDDLRKAVTSLKKKKELTHEEEERLRAAHKSAMGASLLKSVVEKKERLAPAAKRVLGEKPIVELTSGEKAAARRAEQLREIEATHQKMKEEKEAGTFVRKKVKPLTLKKSDRTYSSLRTFYAGTEWHLFTKKAQNTTTRLNELMNAPDSPDWLSKVSDAFDELFDNIAEALGMLRRVVIQPYEEPVYPPRLDKDGNELGPTERQRRESAEKKSKIEKEQQDMIDAVEGWWETVNNYKDTIFRTISEGANVTQDDVNKFEAHVTEKMEPLAADIEKTGNIIIERTKWERPRMPWEITAKDVGDIIEGMQAKIDNYTDHANTLNRRFENKDIGAMMLGGEMKKLNDMIVTEMGAMIKQMPLKILGDASSRPEFIETLGTFSEKIDKLIDALLVKTSARFSAPSKTISSSVELLNGIRNMVDSSISKAKTAPTPAPAPEIKEEPPTQDDLVSDVKGFGDDLEENLVNIARSKLHMESHGDDIFISDGSYDKLINGIDEIRRMVMDWDEFANDVNLSIDGGNKNVATEAIRAIGLAMYFVKNLAIISDNLPIKESKILDSNAKFLRLFDHDMRRRAEQAGGSSFGSVSTLVRKKFSEITYMDDEIDDFYTKVTPIITDLVKYGRFGKFVKNLDEKADRMPSGMTKMQYENSYPSKFADFFGKINKKIADARGDMHPDRINEIVKTKPYLANKHSDMLKKATNLVREIIGYIDKRDPMHDTGNIHSTFVPLKVLARAYDYTTEQAPSPAPSPEPKASGFASVISDLSDRADVITNALHVFHTSLKSVIADANKAGKGKKNTLKKFEVALNGFTQHGYFLSKYVRPKRSQAKAKKATQDAIAGITPRGSQYSPNVIPTQIKEYNDNLDKIANSEITPTEARTLFNSSGTLITKHDILKKVKFKENIKRALDGLSGRKGIVDIRNQIIKLNKQYDSIMKSLDDTKKVRNTLRQPSRKGIEAIGAEKARTERAEKAEQKGEGRVIYEKRNKAGADVVHRDQPTYRGGGMSFNELFKIIGPSRQPTKRRKIGAGRKKKPASKKKRATSKVVTSCRTKKCRYFIAS
jgi:hypothetical protein